MTDRWPAPAAHLPRTTATPEPTLTTATLAAITIAGTALTLAPINPAAIRDARTLYPATPEQINEIDPELVEAITFIEDILATQRDRGRGATWEDRANWFTYLNAAQDRVLAAYGYQAPPEETAPAPAVTQPKPAPVPVQDSRLTPENLPRTQAAAQQATVEADNALWDHVEDCARCWQVHMCPSGWQLRERATGAADTARNWRSYDRWFRGGGEARYLAGDWVAC